MQVRAIRQTIYQPVAWSCREISMTEPIGAICREMQYRGRCDHSTLVITQYKTWLSPDQYQAEEKESLAPQLRALQEKQALEQEDRKKKATNLQQLLDLDLKRIEEETRILRIKALRTHQRMTGPRMPRVLDERGQILQDNEPVRRIRSLK
jgi:hypothetical protein